MLSTFRTDDVLIVGDEAAAHQAGLTGSAEEAIVMPMAVFEGDELGASNSGDGLVAGRATLGKQFSEAFGAEGLLVTTGEALAC